MVYQEKEISKVADQLLKEYGNYSVWCFYGEMGSGKTTLIKAICTNLNVIDPLSSPTFSIVNEYLTKEETTIYHFDFYRIRSIEEAEHIGVVEYFDSKNFCFIEWPEKAEPLLPDVYLQININLVDDLTREITVSSHD